MRRHYRSNAEKRITSVSLLLCFSHLRWDFVYQRPQHLLSRAARNYKVFYFEEPVFEADKPWLDIRTERDDVVIAVPMLPRGTSGEDAVTMQRVLLDQLLAGHRPDDAVFWYYTPMALAFSGHLEPRIRVYDCMDELSAFRGAPTRLRELEAELFERADLVFTGGKSLFEAKRDRHSNVTAFPSSIDKAHFAAARAPLDEPADQAAIASPRLGFFGVVDERMDIDLVDRVAALRPAWQLVMIGPVAKIDPAMLPRRPNIHWHGIKSYDQLPAYLAGWTIGFMPFALNESTRFISPTKTPEFLAAGVPVVSTPIRDVVTPYGDLGLVEIAADAADVVAKAQMLMERPRAQWLRRVDHHLGSMSWDATWADMNRLIAQTRGRDAFLGAAPAALAPDHMIGRSSRGRSSRV